ncbi:unannotated protein [freshwater metagenome]|uniref:Unannotated protein n=1 Tax=freshwater metagenome TaxID=449393 RepID=A0A6J5YKV5_9ZZZZ
MPSSIAPRSGECPGALEPEVKIVLGGVADRAVALQRLAGHHLGSIRCEALRHRHTAIEIGLAVGQRVGRVPHHRAGERDLQFGIGEMVLDRLKAADRDTELLAGHDVLDGHGDHALGHADEFGGSGNSTTVEGEGHGSCRSITRGDEFGVGLVPFRSEEATSTIHRGLRGETQVGPGNSEQRTVALGHEQIGDMGIDDEGLTLERNGGDGRTVRKVRQPCRSQRVRRRLGKQWDDHCGGLEKRGGKCSPTSLGEDRQ